MHIHQPSGTIARCVHRCRNIRRIFESCIQPPCPSPGPPSKPHHKGLCGGYPLHMHTVHACLQPTLLPDREGYGPLEPQFKVFHALGWQSSLLWRVAQLQWAPPALPNALHYTGECWALALRQLAVWLPSFCMGPVGACVGPLPGTTSCPALAGHAAGSRLGAAGGPALTGLLAIHCWADPAGAVLIHKHHPAPQLVYAPGPAHHLAAGPQHRISTPASPGANASCIKEKHAHGALWPPQPSPPSAAVIHTRRTGWLTCVLDELDPASSMLCSWLVSPPARQSLVVHVRSLLAWPA
ncbi:hypothetical protein HaLaN_12695 [Haematococcus lacustris]|uniref:Uncharacterized protein n=1 Tax=Haematococcus lacustris TaxID=44745 RepID=A0A699ZBP1_HAELA|nr:hypothetical protein HaLaN_12695 [Haematococcus lacustris]